MSTPSQKWELNEFNDNDLTYYGGDVRAIETWWIMFHLFKKNISMTYCVRDSSSALIPTNYLNYSVHLTNQLEKLPEDMATIRAKLINLRPHTIIQVIFFSYIK